MTNEQIIYNHQLDLLKRGIIGTTGHIISGQDEEGNQVQIEELEPIHTYVGWQQCGYQVKKGQKAIATFNIWKCANKKKEKENQSESDEEEKEYMFLTKAFFFAMSQVEKIKGENEKNEEEIQKK